MESRELNGQDYLKTYYEDRQNDPENLSLWSFIIKATAELKPRARVLDLGSGPTVYQATFAARLASTVVLSDSSAELLGFSERWLKGAANAHDWDPYVKRILELEASLGVHSNDSLVERREKIRRISSLAIIDIQKPPLWTFVQKFDLVQNLFMTTAAAISRENFFEIWKKCVDYAAPGGDVVFIDLCDSSYYITGGKKITVFNTSYEEQRKLARNLGCEVVAENFFPAHKGQEYGYSGLSMFHMKKPLE